jgi:hypothetical protein
MGQGQVALIEFRAITGKSVKQHRYFELFQHQVTKTFESVFSEEPSTTLSERYYLDPDYGRLSGRYSLEFELSNEGSLSKAIFSGVLGGGSLTVIPTWATDCWRIEATLYNPSGERVFSKQYYDGMKTYVWFPLIFRPLFAPAKSPAQVSEGCIRNMAKCMLRDAEVIIRVEDKYEEGLISLDEYSVQKKDVIDKEWELQP